MIEPIPERPLGYYWVAWSYKLDEPFIAEYTYIEDNLWEKNVLMWRGITDYVWYICGESEQLHFDECIFVVLSEKLTPPKNRNEQ